MPISYSGITNYGCVTLPSVEAGLGSINILRDPPKSIMTRKIDKVGETSSLTELCDQSGNRACEAINLYARSVNPMVSVSYGNYGNNGGQRSGGLLNNGGTQAFLPYTVAKDGAFRPPIIRLEQLMPLSRQPRINTEAFTQPGFADFSKKMMCPGGKYKGVKLEGLKGCVRPTATYQIETPAVEPFEVKYVIQNPIKVSAGSGMRTQDLTTQEVNEPSGGINKNVQHSSVRANYGSEDTVRYSDNSHMDTERYIQNPLNSSVKSKVSSFIQITPIEDVMDVDIRTKDVLNVSYTAPLSGNTKEEHIHSDPEYKRRVVMTQAITNKNKNIYVKPDSRYTKIHERNRPIATAVANHGTIQRQSAMDIGSREFRLNEKISAGSFTGRGQMPTLNTNQTPNFESDRVKMSRKVMEMQQGRFAS